MTSVIAFLARFAAIVLGYASACLSASVFLNLLIFGVEDLGTQGPQGILLASRVVSVTLLALIISYLAFIPALAAIAAAELLAWRDWLTYALVGGATGLVAAFFRLDPGSGPPAGPAGLAAVAAAGMLAGIVYWMAAGRGAGGRRARPPTSPGRR